MSLRRDHEKPQYKFIPPDDIVRYLVKYSNDNTIQLDLKHPMGGQLTKYTLQPQEWNHKDKH